MRGTRFGYDPALDGMRALAIGLVLATHSLPHADGGAYGVNIFFTLSGFLITALLLVEYQAKGSVWFAGFYARRALRLLPPLVVMLTLVAVIPDIYRPGTAISRWYTIPAALFYVANIVAGLGNSLGFLAHTWSLAIEEQFYFIWPIAVVALARKGVLRHALPVLILLSVVVRAVITAIHEPGAANWLPAQSDQLLIGALLAVLFLETGLPQLRRSVFGWAALAVLAALCLVGSATHTYAAGRLSLYGGLTVAGIASAVLIGHLTTTDRGLLRMLFTLPPVVWIGRVSYGIYLFHYPIFQWIQHEHWSRPKEYMVEYALMALVVAVSWFVVERPALRLKNRKARTRPIASALELAPDTV